MNKRKGEPMKLSNNKHGNVVSVLHGENFMRRIDALPKGKTTKAKMYVVGHSESGHNHVLTSPKEMEVLEFNGHRYVLIDETAELFHQKTFDIHETVTVEPGVYEITHKTEYDPFQKVIRAVWD
jgi:hypothetical protein